MRAAPEIIEETPETGALAALLRAPIERAIIARAPFLAPHAPLLSRVARFLVVGVFGLAVDYGVFALIYGGGAGAPIARAVSLVVATFVTWALNRLFTFESSGRTPAAEMARYAGVALVAQGFNYGLFLSLLYAIREKFPFACLFLSAALTAAFSFTGQSLFAFARPGAVATRKEA